ncbi:zinc-dependent alcohol dehydrogenase family protein [Chelatococcus sambhunathii]|uniref:alcohol dehydrogenase n=1 Tax=Chelatococcus sambhunathii TaxID=363953 RepID=A0ABU1DGV4_9HYPH|nr:zinc-dependent alcohol dehydrogenase family protein [Chelatococcus sambhunathii]MDR4307270.1 zinc-dependent alcohol dehydrogenase family protein [Chelatococcus sambhunathii]
MKAMTLRARGEALVMEERPTPSPAPDEALLRVEACAVCRTDLHVVDGDLTDGPLPIVPGHEIVGVVEAVGDAVTTLRVGERVGAPWLGKVCGVCPYCVRDEENLCDDPVFTGYLRDGGFATHALVNADFVFPLPDCDDPALAAPLLCAGLIGWRSLRMAGDARRIGFYGFGAAAHILAQICRWQGREVYAFTRDGDGAAQSLATELGAVWAGGSTAPPPQELDAAIIFAPAGPLVPLALRAVRKGGRVVCGGIHMSDLPAMPYRLLWGERQVLSVANLTRRDAKEFLAVVPQAGVRTKVRRYALEEANQALDDLRRGAVHGAAVLIP